MQRIKLLFGILVFVTLSFSAKGQDPDSLKVPQDSTLITPKDTTNIIPVDTTKGTTGDVLNKLVEAEAKKIQDVNIEFVKNNIEHSPDSSYFNVCKITNTTSETKSGYFEIIVPADWNLVGAPGMEMTIQPGETRYFPVRVTISAQATGGMAYSIGGSFKTEEELFSGAAYVKIPLHSDWEMYVIQNTVYFNEFYEQENFEVFIKNYGNSEELVSLNFKVGKLFEILEIDTESDLYLLLPPHADTALTFTVLKRKLNEDIKYAYNQVWKESLIDITAQTTTSKPFRESIQFIDLENEYTSPRDEKASPLNFDVSINNLLSTVNPRINTMVFGEIQFKKEHDLYYGVRARNLFYTPNVFEGYFDNANNFSFNVIYDWKDKVHVNIGDVNNTSLHSLRGWGINGSYKYDKYNKTTASYIIGKFYPLTGMSIRHNTRIKDVSLFAGATYEQNSFLFYDAFSAEVGGSYSLFRNHLIKITLLGTQSTYDQNQGLGAPNDTTVLGFSYLASYSGSVQKFRFGVNTKNDQFNYLRIRPSQSVYGYLRYLINAKSRINFTSNYSAIQNSKLLFGTYYQGWYNKQQIYRLTYSRRLNKSVMLETGPTARFMNRYQIDTSNTVSADFTNSFVGLYLMTRIRFDEFRFLTPSISAGVTYFTNKLATVDTLPVQPTFNTGISYTDRNWGANATYIYGTNSFVSQTFFDDDITAYETIHLRGYYGQYINKRKMKFTGYANYYLRLPSNRQNFVLSGRMDFYLPKRWNAYVSANLFTNSVATEANGIVDNRNFSLNAGVKKSIDIPQPRIKYYDLNVICFNDLNSDGIRDDSEPLLPNIKIKIYRDLDLTDPNLNRFSQQELITDPDGLMYVIDIPEGKYIMEFDPLINLGHIYNSLGDIQNIDMTANTTLYVPYVESYKVKGKVILERDEYSSLGLIVKEGLRVTATAEDGSIYTTLTDGDGNYLINIPKGGTYTVRINNIFGEEFSIQKEEYLIQFDKFKSFTVDFKFIERKRKVNTGGAGSLFDFKSIND